MRTIFNALRTNAPAAEAHCDGPCGVYDPASARIAGVSTVPVSSTRPI